MKIKDEIQTCGGMTKEHAYLGHFTKAHNISRGHNSDPMPEDKTPQRNILINSDPTQKRSQKIPNVYRGELQPDFDSGDSLPEVYDRKKPVET
jgi:hypothetical protein